METLIVWTLLVVAVVSVLGWLIARKLQISRKDDQIESEPLVYQSEDNWVQAAPSLAPADENPLPVEPRSLTEQVRSYEIALASLQCEIEALRAENSWLKSKSLGDRTAGRDIIARSAETDLPPAIDQDAEGLSDDGRKWAALKSLVLPAIAVVTLIVAVVSDYYAGGKNNTIPIRYADTETQSNVPTGVTEPTVKPANVDVDPDASTTKREDALVGKTRSTVPAGTFYKVVRPTSVHSQPNPSSRPVAEIKPGMDIKVVGFYGEWLKVRSLYGRPPGFIRKETVVSKRAG